MSPCVQPAAHNGLCTLRSGASVPSGKLGGHDCSIVLFAPGRQGRNEDGFVGVDGMARGCFSSVDLDAPANGKLTGLPLEAEFLRPGAEGVPATRCSTHIPGV